MMKMTTTMMTLNAVDMKELSKITMPVVFNEPLSFLQRMMEYMEYSSLLKQASTCDNPVQRLEVNFVSSVLNICHFLHLFEIFVLYFLLLAVFITNSHGSEYKAVRFTVRFL